MFYSDLCCYVADLGSSSCFGGANENASERFCNCSALTAIGSFFSF